MMRKEQKKYGTKNLIEGNYSKNDSIVIIEDVLTTGKSLTESLEHLKDFKIEKIIVIVDREEGGKEKLESLGYSIESIFSIKDFKN
jgi:uridine monophosphate synthetase